MPGSLGRTGKTPFVGRAAELAVLELLWAAACGGGGKTALVSGPAGIGKSRFVREFASAAGQNGALVAIGAAYEGEASLPFGAIREALRSLARTAPPPATARLQEALEALSRAGDDMDRQTQFESVVAALEATTAEAGRCLLVLEDVHWADESTLRLLTHVTRQIGALPVLLVATLRPEEPLSPAGLHIFTEAVRREYLGERIALQSLPDDAARQLVAAAAQSLAPEMIDLLVDRGDGNPFFLEELARDAATPSLVGLARVPHAVADLVLYRLATLPSTTRDVAAAAAVLSEHSRAALIRDVVGVAQDTVADAMDVLGGIGVLLTDDPARIEFRHALFRDAIYGAIPLTRRNELHLAAAAAILSEQGEEPAAAVIAAHLEAEGSRESRQRAAALLVTAAQRSLRLLAYEDAARQYERALALLAGTGETRQRQLAIELSLAEAQRLAGDANAALARFHSCADTAASLHDARSEAEAALGFEQTYLATGRPRSEPDAYSVALLTRALAAVGESDAGLRARLLAALSQARFFAGDQASADSLSLQSLALSRNAAHRIAEAAALESRRIVIWGPDDLEGRLAISRSIIELGADVGDRERQLQGLFWEVGCLVEAGATIEAQLSLRRFTSLARELRNPLQLAESLRMEAMFATLHGELARASELAVEALRLGLRAGYEDGRIHHVAYLVDVLEDSGGDKQTIEELIRDPEPWLQSPMRRGMLSHLSTRVGRLDFAERLIGGLAADGFTTLPRDWMWLPMMYLLCDAVRRLDNATWARELYDLLLPYADRYTVNSNTVCYGSVELALGSVAATMREPVAEAHLRRAIERNHSIDAPVFVARARERLGALLVELGRRDEAIDELQRTGEAYSRFDLSVAAQRVADLMPEEASAEPVSSMGSLTAREVEVLRLLAGGASNKEIADRLYLSLRTVERHITNLYAKIEARGKADATAYALRHGLLS